MAKGIGLALALAFVFTSAFIPHLVTFNDVETRQAPPSLPRLAEASWEAATGERDVYGFPMHVDEHVHWVHASNMQRHDDAQPPHPYTGEDRSGEGFTSLRGSVHEKGFHLFLAEAQELTGISFATLFTYLPALWLTFTALAVWALVRPHPAAIPSAAFVGLVPTTVRFLGPGFLVPIGFVLAWIPVTLILAEPARKRAAATLLLLAVVAWAFFIHLLGGFAVLGLLLAAALMSPREEAGDLIKLLLIVMIPLAWLYRSFATSIQREIAAEQTLPLDFTIFDHFGVYTLFVWGAGVAALVLQGAERRSPQMRTLAVFSVGALALIVGGQLLGLDRYATYSRWHPLFLLAASVPTAYALTLGADLVTDAASWVRNRARDLSNIRPPKRLALAVGPVLATVLALALISQATGYHLDERYYRVINDEDWERIQAADEVADERYEVFLMHPWKAPVMTAVTGKQPHAWLNPGQPPVNGEDYDRFTETGGTLEFFVLNEITLVVSERKPPIDEFIPLAEGVWGMEPDKAQAIYELRQDRQRAGRQV